MGDCPKPMPFAEFMAKYLPTGECSPVILRAMTEIESARRWQELHEQFERTLYKLGKTNSAGE